MKRFKAFCKSRRGALFYVIPFSAVFGLATLGLWCRPPLSSFLGSVVILLFTVVPFYMCVVGIMFMEWRQQADLKRRGAGKAPLTTKEFVEEELTKPLISEFP